MWQHPHIDRLPFDTFSTEQIFLYLPLPGMTLREQQSVDIQHLSRQWHR